MANLTPQQANKLANSFSVMGQSVLEYRIQNIIKLSKPEYQELIDLHRAILHYADHLYTLSAIIIIDDVQKSLSTIDDVTAQIKKTYKTLQNVQKAIDVAVSIVTVGASLFSKNPKAIADSISGLVDTWKSNLP